MRARNLLPVFGVVAIAALPAASSAAPVGSQNQLTAFSPTTTSSNTVGGPMTAYSPSSRKTLAIYYDYVGAGASSPNGTVAKVVFMNPDGTFSGTPQVVSSAAVPSPQLGQRAPALAPGPDGTWLVAWLAENKSRVYGRVIDASGNPTGSPLTLTSNTNYSQVESMAIQWSGDYQRYLLAMSATTNPFPSPAAPQQIVGRFLDSSGAGIGNDFQATTTSAGINDTIDLAYGNGRWVAVGKTNSTSAGYTQGTIVGQVVDAAGPQGSPVIYTPAAGFGPGIAYNCKTDRFMLTWGRNGPPGQPPLNELVRFIDGTGQPVGALSDVIDLGSPGTRPRVVSLGGTGYLVTWHGPSYLNNTPSIKAAQVANDGTITVAPQTVSISPALTVAWRPSVAYDRASGNALIAYPGQPASGFTNFYSRAWNVTQPQQLISVSAAGDGKGTITSTCGLSCAKIDCGPTCSDYFDYGDTVTLTATPEAGMKFAGWGGSCSGSSLTCELTADGAKSVTATFVPDTPEPGPGPGPGPGPSPEPSNSFRAVTGASSSGEVVTVARVPSAGKVKQVVTRVSGGRRVAVCSTPSKSAAGAGRVRLACKVDSATRNAQRKGSVRLRVRVTYTPTGGTPRTLTRYVTLRSLKPRFTG